MRVGVIYSFAVFAVAILLQAGLEKAVRAEDGAASFKPLEMPTAASLGFSVAKYRVGEYTGLLTRDLLDARSYVFATNLDGSRSLELVETLGGAAILRVERADGTVTIETFRPGRLRHTEVHRPVGDELEEVESTDWLPEGPRSEKYRLQLAKLRSCASDSVTEEQVNKVLAAYDPKLAGAALRTGTDIIGPFKLSGGCDRFRGGLPNLGKILNNAVSKGMACLAKNSPPVGNHPVRADMARLYTMLASGNKKDAPPTANLVCDANIGTDWAQGLPCAKDGSAATIKLNLAALDPVLNNRTKADGSNPEVEGTLFHEALHFFYHDHNKGIDLCYMAEYCCFKNDEQACALMKDPKLADPNYWKTEEYLKKYTVIMFKNGRGDFAVPTAIGATLASSPADPAALKAVMEALPASELGPSGVRLLNGVILMASKRKLVGPNETSSNDGLTEGQIAAKGASAIYGQLVGVAIGPYSDDERKRLIDEKLQSMKQMVCSRPQNAEDRGTFYTTFGNDIAWIKKVWRAQGPFPASLNELTPKSICAGP